MAYVVLAWVAALRNRFDEAVADGERAITLDPNNTVAYIALADISNIEGKYEAELAYAQKAIRLDPSHPANYLCWPGLQ